MSRKINKKGFTLIEVVLVLAIGGLIFLLAFLAFQNASKNRRDTQRRADAGKVVAEITNAQSDGVKVNDQGTLDTLNTNYLETLKGPSEKAYTLNYRASTTAVSNADDYTMWVGIGYKCADNSNNKFATSSGNIAVIVDLEKSFSCRDDQ